MSGFDDHGTSRGLRGRVEYIVLCLFKLRETHSSRKRATTPRPRNYGYLKSKANGGEVMQQDYRPLTHDERKAAEAAFKGTSFDPKWSEAARKVYLGISSAMANKRHDAYQDIRPAQPTLLSKRAAVESKQSTRVKSTFW
jgi:hypothetical protein